MDFEKLVKKDDSREFHFDNILHAKSEVYYFDENGNSVDKDQASRIIIRKLDESGNLINEVFGSCAPSTSESIESSKKI